MTFQVAHTSQTIEKMKGSVLGTMEFRLVYISLGGGYLTNIPLLIEVKESDTDI